MGSPKTGIGMVYKTRVGMILKKALRMGHKTWIERVSENGGEKLF